MGSQHRDSYDFAGDYNLNGIILQAHDGTGGRFGEGGVEKIAKEYKKEFLGKIPINIDLRVAADSGTPLVESSPNHETSLIFKEMAQKIKDVFK